MATNLKYNNIFSFEDGDVVQDNGLTPDDIVTATDSIMECTECEQDIEKDLVSLENNLLAYEKLEEQQVKNENMLEGNPEGIMDEDIVLSQETLLTTLRTLGYSKKDIQTLSLSSEARANKYEALAISNEGIIDSIKQILKGIVNLFISIGKKIKLYIVKFVGWLTNRKSSLQSMLIFCQRNSDLELPSLDANYTKKLSVLHSAYLEANNGVLDIEEIIKYYTDIANDPFIEKINDFLDVLNQPADRIESAAEKLTVDIKRAAEKSQIHKKLLALVSKSSNEEPVFILGVNGNKITSYNYANSEKADRYKLGFSLSSFKLSSSGSFKELKGCRTLGDLANMIQKILVAVDTAWSYGQHVEKANNTAIKSVESFSKKMKNDSITNQIQKEIINHGLRIIKDMGSRTLVVLISNHAKNSSNLTKTVSYYVKPVMKATKKAEKLAAKQK